MISYIFKRMVILCQLQNLCNRQIRVQINLIMRQHKYHIKCQSETLFFFLFFSFIFRKTFVGVQLLYDVVLVSTVQQSKSAICIHILPPTPLFWIFFPFRSPQSTEKSSLCYTVGSLQLSILYIVVYICQSPKSSHLLCNFNLSHLKQSLFGKINIFLGQHAE